jgi:hypothetical protein
MSGFGGWDDDEDEEGRPPPELDADSARKVARSFYLVRVFTVLALLVTLAVVGVVVLVVRS